MLSQKKRNIIFFVTRIPTIGILIFIGLFIYSSSIYPGGSQVNLDSHGFDWINNYWCNLMKETGMNGQPNPARPVSIFALLILCSSLAVFFVQFAIGYSKSKVWLNIIKISGIFSMVFAVLIFTRFHDTMTIISSFFGLITIVGIIREIYKNEKSIYQISGVFCIILLAFNNIIYYTEHFIVILPLLQKVTFGFVLVWVIGLNNKLANLKVIKGL